MQAQIPAINADLSLPDISTLNNNATIKSNSVNANSPMSDLNTTNNLGSDVATLNKSQFL